MEKPLRTNAYTKHTAMSTSAAAEVINHIIGAARKLSNAINCGVCESAMESHSAPPGRKSVSTHQPSFMDIVNIHTHRGNS